MSYKRELLHTMIDKLPDEAVDHIGYIINSINSVYVDADDFDKALIEDGLKDNEELSELSEVAKKLGIKDEDL